MMQIGLIGCGAWGYNYLKTLLAMPEVIVQSVCDVDEEVLGKVRFAHPLLKLNTSYRDLLEGDQVQAVIVAAPPKSHFLIASEFLMRKKAVLVEKPATLSYEEAKKLVRLARANRTILMAGHLMAYLPAVERLRQYIRGGKLGKLRYILSERTNLGKIRSDVSVLWDLAVHDLSIVRYLVGRRPVWVAAQGESYLQDGVCDLTTITMGFPKDLFVQIHANWICPVKRRQTVVAGDRMMACVDEVKDDLPLQLISYAGDILMPKLEKIPPLTAQCRHFIHCVQSNDEPRTGPGDITWVLKVMELIERSMRGNGARLYF